MAVWPKHVMGLCGMIRFKEKSCHLTISTTSRTSITILSVAKQSLTGFLAETAKLMNMKSSRIVKALIPSCT